MCLRGLACNRVCQHTAVSELAQTTESNSSITIKSIATQRVAEKISCKRIEIFGAEGGIRTLTGLLPTDFKSVASAIPPPRRVWSEDSIPRHSCQKPDRHEGCTQIHGLNQTYFCSR